MLTTISMVRSLRFTQTMYCDRKSYTLYEIGGYLSALPAGTTW